MTFRKKIYKSIEELQADLDEWLIFYNQERTHSGKYCFGKTPYQTFIDSIPLAKEKLIQYEDKIFLPQAAPTNQKVVEEEKFVGEENKKVNFESE